jgi:hypothetical protein
MYINYSKNERTRISNKVPFKREREKEERMKKKSITVLNF